MKPKETDLDTLSYLRIRYGVRMFGVEMDKDIHSNSAAGIHLWTRAKRRQFKTQFAIYSYNHTSDETVEYMVNWVGDYLGVGNNIKDTAVELALEYDPTYKLKIIRLIHNYPFFVSVVFGFLLVALSAIFWVI